MISASGDITTNEYLVCGFLRNIVICNKDIVNIILDYFHEKLFASETEIKQTLNNLIATNPIFESMKNRMYILLLNIKDTENVHLLFQEEIFKLFLISIFAKRCHENLKLINRSPFKKPRAPMYQYTHHYSLYSEPSQPKQISDAYIDFIEHNDYFKEIHLDINKMKESLQNITIAFNYTSIIHEIVMYSCKDIADIKNINTRSYSVRFGIYKNTEFIIPLQTHIRDLLRDFKIKCIYGVHFEHHIDPDCSESVYGRFNYLIICIQNKTVDQFQILVWNGIYQTNTKGYDGYDPNDDDCDEEDEDDEDEDEF